MSSNELPSPAGSEAKSVFNIFGYGEHQTDQESLKTVEMAKMQRSSRRKSSEKVTSSIAPLSPESARKVRVNLPESSKLALQTLGSGQQSGPSIGHETDSPDWHQKRAGSPFSARRYSKAQGEETEDTFNTDEILHKFNSSMVLQHYKTRPSNLYESSVSDDEGSSTGRAPFMNKYLRRRVSAPDISKIKESSLLPLAPTSAVESPDTSPVEPPPGLISRYLGRRGSAGQILATMSRGAAGEGSSENKDNSALVKSASSSVLAPQTASSTDVTDGPSFDNTQAPSTGFGILSRTRQFGAWLTKATEGEKLEVTRPDLNAVAPTSF